MKNVKNKDKAAEVYIVGPFIFLGRCGVRGGGVLPSGFIRASLKTQKFASIDATRVFLSSIKRDARSGSCRWLSVTVSVALGSLQGIISRLSAVGPSLSRTNKRRRSSDVGATGPVRNLCTYMLITHLFPSPPPPQQQQHVETSVGPAAV